MNRERKSVNASLRKRKMSQSDKRRAAERPDRFTYRTSEERGRRIRQRALDTGETYEEILDRAIDRFFKDPKAKNNRTAPRNTAEAHYIERVLLLLRDRKSVYAPGLRAAIDLLLKDY